MAITTAPPHAQQVDESLPPLADLSITSEYEIPVSPWAAWEVTVTNNTVGNHPGAQVHLVKVRITISDSVRGATSWIWIIGNLQPGESATRNIDSLANEPGVTDGPAKVPQRFYAEIIESDPVEAPRFRSNNSTEHWGIEHRRPLYQGNGATLLTNGDVVIGVGGISDRSPQPGGVTTFTVTAYNDNRDNDIPDVGSSDEDHTLFEVQVEISLSPGLSFAGTQAAPGDTTFDTSTGIWNVGTLGFYRSESPLSFPVAVDLTTEYLSDLPLEERCLTAKVVKAVPGFASHPLKRGERHFHRVPGVTEVADHRRRSRLVLPLRLRGRDCLPLHRQGHGGNAG